MNRTNILKILFVVFCLSVLSCSLIGCEDKELLDPTKSQQDNEIDILRKYQLKNESDLDKIREYNLENYQEYNGDTNFWKDRNTETSLAESKYKGTYESSTGLFSRTATNSIVEKSNADRLYEDQDQLVSWLYYDTEEDEWGDAYYYVLKTDDGRENYEYAYSVIKGKKKVYDRLNGSRGQTIIISEDTKVPDEVREHADKNFITIIRMPDSEFSTDYIDDGMGKEGQTFTDSYERLEYLNDPQNKEKTAVLMNNVREELMSEPLQKFDIIKDKDYLHNLERKIQDQYISNTNKNNDSSHDNDYSGKGSSEDIDDMSITDDMDYSLINSIAEYKSVNILNKYDNDYSGKGSSEEENEEIDYLDYTFADLNDNNLMIWSNIGYASNLVVIKVNNLNRILTRKEAYNLIDDMYNEKYKIIKEATNKKELQIATGMTVTCPSAREVALVNYCQNLQQDFMEKYFEKLKELN